MEKSVERSVEPPGDFGLFFVFCAVPSVCPSVRPSVRLFMLLVFVCGRFSLECFLFFGPSAKCCLGVKLRGDTRKELLNTVECVWQRGGAGRCRLWRWRRWFENSAPLQSFGISLCGRYMMRGGKDDYCRLAPVLISSTLALCSFHRRDGRFCTTTSREGYLSSEVEMAFNVSRR